MSSRQLAGWMAYDRVDPFGESRADYRNGLLISVIMAIMGKEARPQDFMLSPEDRGQSATEQHPNVARFEEMFEALNEGTTEDDYSHKPASQD